MTRAACWSTPPLPTPAGHSEEILGQLLADVIPRDELVDRHQGRLPPRRATTPHRRVAGRPAAGSGRVAAPADDRPRRPLAGARPRRRRAVRGDARRAGLGGREREGPLRRRLELLRLAHRRRPPAWQRAVPGRAPLVTNQVSYSLLERGVEREVVPACAAAGLGHPGLLTARRRRPDRQVPRRSSGRLARRRTGAATWPSTGARSWPASSRRSPRRPRAWPPVRSRSRWPGSATSPG